jgi:hypothetical protein
MKNRFSCKTPTALVLGACLLLAGFHLAASEPSPTQSRLGMNLSGPADWNTELPFVDVFRMARKWISQRKDESWGKGPPIETDQHGWIKRLEPDCWAETLLCTIEGGHYPIGEYVCLYEGEGRIEFNGIERIISRQPGRIVFEPKGRDAFFLQLRATDPDNPVRNIRVIMPGFEAGYREEPWHPAFLTRWRNFNTFRFMDWMKTNGSNIRGWDERPTPEFYTTTDRGIPLEWMIDLCNRLDVNPWFCMPHLAGDDYVRQFARQVKRELKPGLTVYIEYSNEIWNSMFAQTKYSGDKGLELKLADKHWEAAWRYSALRSVEIFKIFEEVFGGTERLVRVMATQAANPYISQVKLGFQDAWRHCDALAIAPYVSMNLSPGGKPTSEAVGGWTVDQVLDYLEQKALPESTRWIEGNKTVADKFNLRLIVYEGGQHAVGVGGGENNDALTRLLHAANRHPRMGTIYTRHLDAWRDQGGGDLFAIYASVSRWSKWGSWGLIEYYDDTTPKYEAVMKWNMENKR